MAQPSIYTTTPLARCRCPHLRCFCPRSHKRLLLRCRRTVRTASADKQAADGMMAGDRAIGGCHCGRCHARHGHLSLAKIRDGLAAPRRPRWGRADRRFARLRRASAADCVTYRCLSGNGVRLHGGIPAAGCCAAAGEAREGRQVTGRGRGDGRGGGLGRRISIGDGDGGYELGMGEA